MDENILEVIANEFGFNEILKAIFLGAVEISRERQQKRIEKGASGEELRERYLTPYELAEQIYTKRREINTAVGKHYRVKIEISRNQ